MHATCKLCLLYDRFIEPAVAHDYCHYCHIEPLQQGANHIPKAVSDRDPLPDWVRDLNYVHSQALELPSQSRTGSAHCEVIFCSYCDDWPMQCFSAHLQNAHTRIMFQKSFAFTSPQNKALHSQRVKSVSIGKGSESRSERAFKRWFARLWTGPSSVEAVSLLPSCGYSYISMSYK